MRGQSWKTVTLFLMLDVVGGRCPYTLLKSIVIARLLGYAIQKLRNNLLTSSVGMYAFNQIDIYNDVLYPLPDCKMQIRSNYLCLL